MISIIKTIRDFFKPAPKQTLKTVKPLQTFEEIHGTTSEEKRILYYLRDSKSTPRPQAKARRLPFEFVPGSQSNRNVRSFLEFHTGDFKAWQNISRECEARAGGKCEICGHSSKEENQGAKKYHTECHEVWSYDTSKKIQKLIGLQSLCAKCHQTKHLNQFDKFAILLPELSTIRSEDLEKFNELKARKTEAEIIYFDLLRRYRVINSILPIDAKREYKLARKVQSENTKTKFLLDLSLINEVQLFDCHAFAFNKFLTVWKNGGEE